MSDIFDVDTLILDLKNNEYKEVEIHQFDDVILNFNIVNYGLPVDLTSYTIEFRCVKPTTPESYVIQTKNITKNSSGKVTIACKKDVVNVSGNVRCELRLINSYTSQLSTFDFILVVKKSVLDGVNSCEPFVIDILGQLNSTLANSLQENDTLNTSITNAQSQNDTLNIAITKAQSTNSTLNNAISDGNSLNNTLNDTISSANNTKTIFTNSVNSNSTIANNASLNLQGKINAGNNLLTNMTTQNNEAETNINQLNTFRNILPSALEFLHTNLNIINMVLFMERNLNIKATNVNENIYIDSFRDATNVTLDGATFDSTNHKISLGSGYIMGLGFCYE